MKIRIASFLVVACLCLPLSAKITLHEAVWNCDLGEVKTLLEGGAPVNEVDKNGDAPLNIAFERCHEAIELLSDYGAWFAFIDIENRQAIKDPTEVIYDQNCRDFASAPIGMLPRDVLALVLTKLSPLERNAARVACKRIRDVIDNKVRQRRNKGGLGILDTLPLVEIPPDEGRSFTEAAVALLGSTVYAVTMNKERYGGGVLPIDLYSYEKGKLIYTPMCPRGLIAEEKRIVVYPSLYEIPGNRIVDCFCLYGTEQPMRVKWEEVIWPKDVEDEEFAFAQNTLALAVVTRRSTNEAVIEHQSEVWLSYERFGNAIYLMGGGDIWIYHSDDGQLLAHHRFFNKGWSLVRSGNFIYVCGQIVKERKFRRVLREEDISKGVLVIDRHSYKIEKFIEIYSNGFPPTLSTNGLVFVFYSLGDGIFSVWLAVIDARTNQLIKRLPITDDIAKLHKSRILGQSLWIVLEDHLKVLDFSGWH
jgi:hypothetical protein